MLPSQPYIGISSQFNLCEKYLSMSSTERCDNLENIPWKFDDGSLQNAFELQRAYNSLQMAMVSEVDQIWRLPLYLLTGGVYNILLQTTFLSSIGGLSKMLCMNKHMVVRYTKDLPLILDGYFTAALWIKTVFILCSCWSSTKNNTMWWQF